MAYIVNTTQTPEATAATFTPNIGAHQTNDLILIYLTQDVGGSAITTATSGWAMIGTQAASGGSRSAFAYKVAASSAEAAPTFSGANDGWLGACLVIRDADPTTPFGSLVSGSDYVRADYATSTSTSGALNTAVDGCLLVYGWGGDGATRSPRCNLADLRAASLQSDATICQIVGYQQQESAGAAPSVTMYSTSASTGGNSWVVAVRNKSGGALQPDIRPTINELYWYGGGWETIHDPSPSWQAPSNFAASINSITCSSTAPTKTTATVDISGEYWGGYTTLTSTESTAGSWVGGTHTISSTDFTSKIVGIQWSMNSPGNSFTQGTEGIILCLSDGTNWVAYQIGIPAKGWISNSEQQGFVAVSASEVYAASGSINLAAVTRVGIFTHRIGSSTATRNLNIRNLTLFDKVAITGGSSSRPATMRDMVFAMNSWGVFRWSRLQSSNQIQAKISVQVGDGGSNTTYFSNEAASFEYPQAWSATNVQNWQTDWNVNASAISLSVNAGASDIINLVSGVVATDVQQSFTINSSSSTSAAYDFSGTSFVGWAPTFKTGIPVTGATFSECDEIALKGADVAQCTIKKTVSTDAACSWDADGATVTDLTIDVTGTSANYHIELGTAVTAITLADVTFTGTPAVDKVHVKATTGTTTITTSGTTSLVAGDVTSDGATVVIAAPALERGLNFTGLIAGSKVKVFSTGTDTEQFSTASSSTTELWDDATAGSLTVDYVILKAGYEPIRVTGVTVTGAVGTGVQDVPVSQGVARWYAASSGLTINTNFYANASTKLWGLTTASTLQNLVCYLLEQWIALGDAGEAFANKQWPIEASGPNSFTWLDGWEADTGTYANSITNLSRDGMRYLDANRVRTAQWAAINSGGVPTGEQVRYQQSDGGTTSNANNTGNIDQLIQIYGDATHGNFDYTGYLVCKVQAEGYDQAEVDVVSQYGTLEDYLYVIGLSQTANTIPTGNPALANPPTITDHGATPVTWNGKDFSITITDSAAGNTAEQIAQWLRYNFEQGGSFQSKNGFDWHDLVQQNGSSYKTVRGKIYGDVGASLKGVRVVQNDGTTEHGGFNLFTADDGTTYSPAVSAAISITNIPDAGAVPTRMQITNVTALSASAWQATTAYSAGDIVLRSTGLGTESTAGLYFRCTTAGTSGGLEPTWDTTVGNTTADGTVTWTTYAVLFYDADPASTSYSATYTNGEEFNTGETVRIRFAEHNSGTSFKRYSTTLVAASTGFSAAMDPTADDVFAENAINGADYEATFSPNFTSDYIVLDSNTDFSGKSAYAYFCYTLTTSNGLYQFWGGVTALDSGNYRIESDVLNLFFDETLGFVKQTDSVRIFRKDGTRPALDPTTGGFGIELNWRVPVNVVSTGGSALTAAESAHLLALANGPSAATISTQVLTDAQTTPVYADIRKVTGATVTGTGSEADPWGPA